MIAAAVFFLVVLTGSLVEEGIIMIFVENKNSHDMRSVSLFY
jgi:hypothetical protein